MSSAINHNKRSHRSRTKHLSAARAMGYNAPRKLLNVGQPSIFSRMIAATRAQLRARLGGGNEE